MMPRNPSNWWSMHSNLRSTSSTSDHHQQQQHQHEAEIVPTNLLISQTHPSNSLLPPLHHYHHGGSSSSSSSSSSSLLLPLMSSNSADPNAQDFPNSWSQLLLGGLASEQDQERFSRGEFDDATRVISGDSQGDVKQEGSNNNQNNNLLELYGSQFHEEHDQTSSSVVGVSNRATATWTQIISASLSPKSCITTLSSSTNTTTTNNNNNNIIISSNMLDFSTNKRAFQADIIHQHSDHTTNSECNSTATTGGVPPKKPRVQSSSTPPLKVRKEKLGDRITALHQLVSPFGKTDTASVLLEAIGYIRFLQGQIEALSSPYMGNNNASANNQHSAHGERNCLFPDHPGQLLNDSCLKRRRASNQEDIKDATKDLKSRGLCLVPISISQLVGSDNGADYWAQSLGGGF